MIARFGFAPRRPGLDIATFQAHWAGRHGQLAAGLPGVRRYWQNHAVLKDGEPLLPWIGFDACAQIEFDSVEAMNAAFADAHYLGPVRQDEDYLVDKPNGGMALVRRIGGAAPDPERGFRLLSFLRLAPNRALDELESVLGAAPRPVRSIAGERFLALQPEAAGGVKSAFDAVDIQWFESAEIAQNWLVSVESRLYRAQFGGLVRGVDRLIARVRVIV